MKAINNVFYLFTGALVLTGLFACKGSSQPVGTPVPGVQEQAIGTGDPSAAPAVSAVTLDQEQPVAKITLTKEEPISIRQLRFEVERMEKQAGGRTMTPEQRREILDIMINERLALQAAERDKVYVEDGEITQEINRMKAEAARQYGWSYSDEKQLNTNFDNLIHAQMGIGAEALKTQLKREATVQKYLSTQKRSIFEKVTAPTEQEVLEFYDQNRARLIRPDTAQTAIILVPFTPSATAEQKAAAKKTADDLYKEISSDSDPATKFDDVFNDRSRAERMGYENGEGFVPKSKEVQDRLGADFYNTVFALKQAQVSRVIETSRGFEIVKVKGLLKLKNLELTDSIEPGTTMTVRDYIVRGLATQRQQEALKQAQLELIDDLRKGNPFEVFEDRLNW